MAFQTYTTTNAEQAFYRDLLAQLVQIVTSSQIASVDNIDAGGTGWTTGDIATYTHASAIHDATFEVTAAAGAVTALRLIEGGSFGRRVASVVVNAGGTNYVNGDIVEIDEGHVAGTDFFQRCKLEITNASGGVVQAGGAAVFEGGGNYEGGTDPTATASTTTLVGPSGGTGSGLTVDVTMQAITPSLNIVPTGAGSGLQIDVTLAHSGWTALRDDHDYSFNSLLDEKQVVLQGTVAGGDEPLVGYISWTDVSGADDFRGVLCTGMDFYNDGLAIDAQIGVNSNSDVPSTTAGAYVPSLDEAESCFARISPRSISGVARTIGTSVTAYHPHYNGLLLPFGTATESPYPMFNAASVSGTQVWNEGSTAPIDATGFGECFRNTNRNGPIFARRNTDGVYAQIINGSGTAFPVQAQVQRVMFPGGAPELAQASDDDAIVGPGSFEFFASVFRNTGAAPSILLKPTPETAGDLHTIWPLVPWAALFGTAEVGPYGTLEDVGWPSGTKVDGTTVGAEDTVTDPVTGDVYRLFPCGVRTQPYSFIGLKEGA